MGIPFGFLLILCCLSWNFNNCLSNNFTEIVVTGFYHPGFCLWSHVLHFDCSKLTCHKSIVFGTHLACGNWSRDTPRAIISVIEENSILCKIIIIVLWMNAENLVVENYSLFQRPNLGFCMTLPVSLGTVLCLCRWFHIAVKKVIEMCIKTERTGKYSNN